jgi:CDP-6-deoxy-D-xylo-4-hexulose-3-dehydrase
VDADPNTLAIDLGSAASAIGPSTKALILIHPLGRAGDLDRYTAFCVEHGLILLEDACESLGAHSDGLHVGRAGMCGSFSFYFSHHLSTIEGGMIITDDAALADDLRGARAHGWIRDRSDRAEWLSQHAEIDPRFFFATPGYNVRPTELQAAIGRVQLGRLDSMIESRERLAHTVNGWLTEYAPWLQLIGSDRLPDGHIEDRRARVHSWMTLPIRVAPSAPATRDRIVEHLEAAGVETRPIIAGNLARHPAVDHIRYRSVPDTPISDGLLRESFMIGCHPFAAPRSLHTLEMAIASLAGIE